MSLYTIPDLVWEESETGDYWGNSSPLEFRIWRWISYRNGEKVFVYSAHHLLDGDPSSDKYNYRDTLEEAKADANRINRELLEKMLTKVEVDECLGPDGSNWAKDKGLI